MKILTGACEENNCWMHWLNLQH